MYYVYILWSDTRHYIGTTSDIKRRIKEHTRWQTISTKNYKNTYLIGYFQKESKAEAMKLERMIKRNWHIEHWINHQTFIKE